MFGPEFEKRVDDLVAKYPQPRAALLPVLCGSATREIGIEPLLAAIQEQGGEVSSVYPQRDTLEDLFLQEVRGEGGES